jgi:hypothetical protein
VDAGRSVCVHGEPLDTAAFLKKVPEYDARLQAQRRGALSAAQKEPLASYRLVRHFAITSTAFCGAKKAPR